ncbi:alpha-glucan family phosphorylase [Gemmatimonadota bacterium]
MPNHTPDHLPERLHPLWALANNLWWSWHPKARRMFRNLDIPLWRSTHYNPVAILRQIDAARLEEVVEDASFLRQLDDVFMRFEDDLNGSRNEWTEKYGISSDRPVAYFCAEFGLHSSVPIYSGGLGVLAGDHCKEASDLHLPFVGVGLLYQKGYFHQRLRANGTQEAIEEVFDPECLPLNRIQPEGNGDYLAEVRVGDRLVQVTAWQIDIGRTRVYLLDTDLPGNAPEDQELTAQLYAGDEQMRIRQEMILGIGGVRVLRALGIAPSFWHLNEGHTAFLSLERLREKVAGGMSFEEGVEEIRRNSLFTTHTPVAAGHDRFSDELSSAALGYFIEQAGLPAEAVFGLASEPDDTAGMLSMTALAMRTTGSCNGVSRRHGEVARLMWHKLWPEGPVEEVPIGHITNGVHVPSWLNREMRRVLNFHIGTGWVDRHQEQTIWNLVADIPDEDIWHAHLAQKTALQTMLRERIRRTWVEGELKTIQVVSSGLLLDPEVLTFGFARRFATYKRANLIFRDLDRLKRLLLDVDRPVQIVFAGKAHPRDTHGQELIRHVYQLALDPDLGGRIAFVDDYDLHLAQFLVSGVDVWANNPRPPMEASGTSGEKASVNGVPQFSTLDGWWLEAFSGTNGWAIGTDDWSPGEGGVGSLSDEEQDAGDAESIYKTLESEIIPLYYDRNERGVPVGWVGVMKEAIRTTGAGFSSRRMLLEYIERYYGPASTT